MAKHIFRTFAALALTLMMAGCGGKDKARDPFPGEEGPDIKGPRSENYRMPSDMSEYRNNLDGHLGDVFNDSNIYQLAHARHLGIDPLETSDDISKARRPLRKITDTSTYKLDELTHSVPYLVPEAQKLLGDIGAAFCDSIRRKGLPPVRIRVTSLLRTTQQVKQLRRSNVNATEQSAHQFATTFDIGYNAFYAPSSADRIEDPRYKSVLAEVLYDLRARNRCMVKYERKSPCFHITVIK